MIIEKYQDEVVKSIQAIHAADSARMSIENKLEFFSQTRHSYGRTALLLSGGATFGKFHFGLLNALYDYDLMPRIICGSSVGSMVAAVISSYPYSEMKRIMAPEYVFQNPMLKNLAGSSLEFLFKVLTKQRVLCTETLKNAVRFHTQDRTFKEIYD